MMRSECDNCQKLDDAPTPPRWIILAVEPDAEECDGLVGVLTGGHSHGARPVATLCSWPCVSEYASVRALIPAEDPKASET
jgi:hypothetical protein